MKRADTYVNIYIYGGTHHIFRDDTLREEKLYRTYGEERWCLYTNAVRQLPKNGCILRHAETEGDNTQYWREMIPTTAGILPKTGERCYYTHERREMLLLNG